MLKTTVAAALAAGIIVGGFGLAETAEADSGSGSGTLPTAGPTQYTPSPAPTTEPVTPAPTPAAPAPTAPAATPKHEPTRHCVSQAEFNHVWNMPGPKSYRLSREHLERRWEVARAHKRYRAWDDRRSIAVLYPLCGYAASDGVIGAWWDRKTGLMDGVFEGTGLEGYGLPEFRQAMAARKTF